MELKIAGFALCLLLCSSFLEASASLDLLLAEVNKGAKHAAFAWLLGQVGLEKELEKNHEQLKKGVTVFAPSDDYLVKEVSPAMLSNLTAAREVLLHHIVPKRLSAQAWYPGSTVRSLAGTYLRLHVQGNHLMVDNVVVEKLGVLETGDGVLHTVAKLLVPSHKSPTEAKEAKRRELQEIGANAPAPAGSPANMGPTPATSPAQPASSPMLGPIGIPPITGIIPPGIIAPTPATTGSGSASPSSPAPTTGSGTSDRRTVAFLWLANLLVLSAAVMLLL